jgi:hypothetical protein
VAPRLRRPVHKDDERRRLLAAAVCDGHVQPPLLALRLASLLALGARGGGEDERLRARAVRPRAAAPPRQRRALGLAAAAAAAARQQLRCRQPASRAFGLDFCVLMPFFFLSASFFFSALAGSAENSRSERCAPGAVTHAWRQHEARTRFGARHARAVDLDVLGDGV